MPTKDKTQANEQAKLRMQCYRGRRNEGLTVTPDKEVTPFCATLGHILPPSECENTEDNPIIYQFGKLWPDQKGREGKGVRNSR